MQYKHPRSVEHPHSRSVLLRTLAALLLMGCAGTSFAGWKAIFDPSDRFTPNSAHINYVREGGFPTFQEALNKLSQDGLIQQLDGIHLSWLLDDSNFQHDIFAALEQAAPRKLAEARRSSGNMHNPKIDALPFDEAVIATPLVKSINSDLAAFGLHASQISKEKFSLAHDKGQERFEMMNLWLIVAPISIHNKSSAPKPK